MKNSVYILFVFMLLFSYSCTTAPEKGKPASPAAGAELLPVEEQESKALDIFQSVYELVNETDRTQALPEIEAAYKEIAEKYPAASLAQESYWRLIKIYVEEYTPPRIMDAESMYMEFTRKYPDSPLKTAADNTLIRTYYREKQWEKLQRFTTPYVKEYIESGKLKNAYFLFLYSEAKFYLGDYTEAAKGYKIIIQRMPKSTESKVSKLRLDEMKKDSK